jgi:hypothetical protein
MCWVPEGDEVHVDAGKCFVEEGQHKFEVILARFGDGDDRRLVAFHWRCLSLKKW